MLVLMIVLIPILGGVGVLIHTLFMSMYMLFKTPEERAAYQLKLVAARLERAEQVRVAQQVRAEAKQAAQQARVEQELLARPARLVAQYGNKNSQMICPHCQTKGEVRALHVKRQTVAISTTNTILTRKSTQTSVHAATQLHCDNCNMTWDV